MSNGYSRAGGAVAHATPGLRGSRPGPMTLAGRTGRHPGATIRVRDARSRTRSRYFSVMVMLPSTQLMLPSSNSLCLPPGTVVSSLVG